MEQLGDPHKRKLDDDEQKKSLPWVHVCEQLVSTRCGRATTLSGQTKKKLFGEPQKKTLDNDEQKKRASPWVHVGEQLVSTR